VLAIALAFAGGFAAIYHPIGTTMLVEAAGDKPGRSIGVNGVFGNLGVALAPVVTAFLANTVSWRAAFVAPGLFCAVVGFLWMRTPLVPAHLHHVNRRPFPPIPRHLVRRAVLVLMLIAMTSGLVFNAFTLLLPKLLQERLAGNDSAPALSEGLEGQRLPSQPRKQIRPARRSAWTRVDRRETTILRSVLRPSRPDSLQPAILDRPPST
jgi:MFS family permease